MYVVEGNVKELYRILDFVMKNYNLLDYYLLKVELYVFEGNLIVLKNVEEVFVSVVKGG